LHPSRLHSPRRIFPSTPHQEICTTVKKEELDAPISSTSNSDGMRLEQIQKENKKLREEMLDIKRSARDYRELTEKLVSELVEIRSEIVKNNGNQNDVIKDLSNVIQEKDPNVRRSKNGNDKIKIEENNISLFTVNNDNVKVILDDDEATEIIDNMTPERPERKNEIFGQLGKIFKSMTTPERIKNKNEIFSQIGEYYKTIKGEMSCQTDTSFTEKEMKISRQRFHDILSSQMERVGLGGLELDDLRSCELDTTIMSPTGSKEQIQTVCNITSEKMKNSGIGFQKLQPDKTFNTKSLRKKKKKKEKRKKDKEIFPSSSGDEPPTNPPLMKATQNPKMSANINKKLVTNLTDKKYINSNQYARKMMSTNRFSSSNDQRKNTTLLKGKELSSSCTISTESNEKDISYESYEIH